MVDMGNYGEISDVFYVCHVYTGAGSSGWKKEGGKSNQLFGMSHAAPVYECLSVWIIEKSQKKRYF